MRQASKTQVPQTFFKLVSFLVLLLALVSPCAAQNEEEEVIDFSIANEGSVNSLEEVVSGVLLIYGEIDTDLLTTGDIDIVVKETLGKVCKNFERTTGAPTLTKMFVDVRTVGQVRLGLNYSWQILPSVEAGKDCINRLAMVGFGPKEPPFDRYPAPPIRQLLASELALHPPTRLLNTTGWTISVQNMSCDLRKVTKHWNHTRSIDVFPTEEPECLGSDSVTWEPNLEGEFDVANVGNCNTAGSNACVCAALPSCEWVPSVNGISTCVHTALPGVPCTACALQAKCVLTDEKLCEMKSTPCACVLAGAGCNWNMVRGVCELNPAGGTPCIACPRQYFCSVPTIRSKSPQNLAVMGLKEVGWLLNMTFDREMEFMHIGIGSGVLMQCRATRPGDWPPTFELPYNKLEIDGNVLRINVFGLPNEEQRDCDLVISDSAVRDSSSLLPYNGMMDNVVYVTLPDGVPPEVNSFIPGNSATGVPVDPLVRFFFNEEIRKVGNGMITVYIMGGNQTNREADKKLADLNLWSAAVSVSQDTLLVDLTGLLSTSTYYSVRIPPGVVSDSSNNAFQGIDKGIYIFQTGAEQRVVQLQDTAEDDHTTYTIIIVVAGSLVGIVALAAGYMALEKVRKVRRRARVVARKVEKEVEVEEAPPENLEKPTLPHLAHDVDDWAVAAPASPTSPSSGKSPISSNVSAKNVVGKVPSVKTPTSRPNVQVFSKPEELKTQVHTQLRESGTVVSLADLHNKSSQMMRTIGQKVDDRKRRPNGVSGALTAPSSPTASPVNRRHSAQSPTFPRMEGSPGGRRLHSAEGQARPRRQSGEGGEVTRSTSEAWPAFAPTETMTSNTGAS